MSHCWLPFLFKFTFPHWTPKLKKKGSLPFAKRTALSTALVLFREPHKPLCFYHWGSRNGWNKDRLCSPVSLKKHNDSICVLSGPWFCDWALNQRCCRWALKCVLCSCILHVNRWYMSAFRLRARSSFSTHAPPKRTIQFLTFRSSLLQSRLGLGTRCTEAAMKGGAMRGEITSE